MCKTNEITLKKSIRVANVHLYIRYGKKKNSNNNKEEKKCNNIINITNNLSIYKGKY